MTDETNPGKTSVEWNGTVTDLVSINTFLPLTINGEYFKIQLTTRHGATVEKITADFNNHVAALAEIRKAHPMTTGLVIGDVNEMPFPLDTEYIPDQQGVSGAPTPVATNATHGTFPAGKIIAEVSNGNIAYKVAAKDGERFPKFPVRIWPEVMDAAGMKYDTINPVKPETAVNLAGWTAEYEKNEKGFPRKVTKLTKN